MTKDRVKFCPRAAAHAAICGGPYGAPLVVRGRTRISLLAAAYSGQQADKNLISKKLPVRS
ncbi:hypothetical protein BA177_11420 [Woeseia oceani]|uniref:Uncharacterized protein n=1 Tax=Woeseia oceani TaxID=1548547 RepID=A0A193LGQ1_9GAMM|nr:hypothetical protein BA177_11420 [Woeseia oceani]